MLELDCLEKVWILDYNTFNELVQNNFDWLQDYHIVADREMNNDQDLLIYDIRKESKYAWEKRDAEDFIIKQPKNYLSVHTIIRILVMRDVLPEGHYIIRVSW